ncbi:MAG: recombinase family protein [candidate division Zixibacteria bacterium]|nr:recombinase family protein [candidate division Zixibacteria bacterium]
MQRAIIYCRVSTEEQAQDGHHSLAAQEFLCRKTAVDQGFEVAAVFKDPGRTATNMHRPGLQDALARCQADHSIKAVFVQDTDRLARNTQDHLTIRAVLKKAGVQLISVSQPMLEDSAEGHMIDTIIASVNQFQSDITSRKTIKGLEEKVRGGGWPALAPLGYRNVGTGQDKQNRVVEVDESVAPLVKRMFELYATGNYSAHELGEVMFGLGLRSRNHKKLQISKVLTILQNPFYIGVVKWGGISAKGTHNPIISEGLYRAVQAVMKGHGGNRSRRRRHDFLLRGYLFCGFCGRRMIGEKHPLKKAAYYRCHKRGGCQPAARTELVENDVSALFDLLTIDSGLINETTAALSKRLCADRKAFVEVRTALCNQKTALESRLTHIERKWLDGVLDDTDFTRLKTQLRADLDTVEHRLADHDLQNRVNVDEVREVVSFAGSIGFHYQQAPEYLKRLLLKLAWERFDVRNNEIVEAVPTPVFRTLTGSGSGLTNAQKPVLLERASVQRGDHHPTQASIERVVRLRTEWGPNRMPNRPENRRKVAGNGNYCPAQSLLELIKDAGYFQQVLALFREIQSGLGYTSKAGGGPLKSASHDTKPIGRLCRQVESPRL